jgi:hypothetical protein
VAQIVEGTNYALFCGDCEEVELLVTSHRRGYL